MPSDPTSPLGVADDLGNPRSREYWLRAAHRVARLGTFVFELATGQWSCDEELNLVLGIAATAEKTLQSWVELVHPEHRTMMAEYFQSLLEAGGKDFDRDYKILRPCDGETRWVAGKARFERDGGGQLVGLVGLIEDITDRKRTEEALQRSKEELELRVAERTEELRVANQHLQQQLAELHGKDAALRASESKLRSITANAPVHILQLTPDGVITYINRVLPQLESAEVVGRSWLEWMEPEQREQAASQLQQARTTGLPQAFETRGEGPEGRYVWYSTRLAPLLVNGEVTSITLISEEITTKKEAEEALLASEERFRTLIEGAPIPIGIQRAGTLLYANRAHLELFGHRDVAELSRQHVIDLVAPESRPEIIERLQRRQQGLPADTAYEFVGLRTDGSQFPCFTTTADVTLADGRATLVFHRDLTATRQATAALRDEEEARLRTESALHHAQKMDALGTLSGGIAHDFNNILTTILTNGHLLREMLPLGSEAQELAEEVLFASKRARDLVQQILTFSRKQEQIRRLQDLGKLVSSALKFLQATLPPNISIEYQPPSAPCEVLADANQLHQVITNLATNAAHAIGDAEGQIAVSVRSVTLSGTAALPCAGLTPGDFAVLSVHDNGRGMSEAVQQRIFEPFFTTKEVGHGTGLGLSIVHGIVASHDGCIHVESEPDQGTVIALYFPLADASSLAEEAPLSIRAPVRSALRILLIDDEPSIVRATGRVLTRAGCVVTGHTSPKAALASIDCDSQSFDLAVLDLAMPEMFGIELATELLQRYPSLPIILASGNASEADVENALRAGVREVVAKPYSTQALLAAVARLSAEPVAIPAC